MPFHFRGTTTGGGGGGATGIGYKGIVANYNKLSEVTGMQTDDIYLVLSSQGTWLTTGFKRAGIYQYDGTQWKKVGKLPKELIGKAVIDYDTSIGYYKGQLVLNSNSIYEANEAIAASAGVFDPTKWTNRIKPKVDGVTIEENTTTQALQVKDKGITPAKLSDPLNQEIDEKIDRTEADAKYLQTYTATHTNSTNTQETTEIAIGRYNVLDITTSGRRSNHITIPNGTVNGQNFIIYMNEWGISNTNWILKGRINNATDITYDNDYIHNTILFTWSAGDNSWITTDITRRILITGETGSLMDARAKDLTRGFDVFTTMPVTNTAKKFFISILGTCDDCIFHSTVTGDVSRTGFTNVRTASHTEVPFDKVLLFVDNNRLGFWVPRWKPNTRLIATVYDQSNTQTEILENTISEITLNQAKPTVAGTVTRIHEETVRSATDELLLDDVTIERASHSLQLKDGGITPSKFNADVYATNAEATAGTDTTKVITPAVLQNKSAETIQTVVGNATTDYNTLGRAETKIRENANNITALQALGNVRYTVADIAARGRLRGMRNGDLAFVTDASGDATVTAGWAIYRYTGTAWQKISEQESLDVNVVTPVDDTTIEKDTADNNKLRIKDGGVSTAKIANNAVTTDKINDDAVTEDKLADNLVTLIEGTNAHERPHYSWRRDISQEDHGDMVFRGKNRLSHYNWYSLAGNWDRIKALEFEEGLHDGFATGGNTTVEFLFYFNSAKFDEATIIRDVVHNVDTLRVGKIGSTSGRFYMNVNTHRTTGSGYTLRDFQGLRTAVIGDTFIVRVMVEVTDYLDNNRYKMRLMNIGATTRSPSGAMQMNQSINMLQADFSMSMVQYAGVNLSPDVTAIPLHYERYLSADAIVNVLGSNSTSSVPSMRAISLLQEQMLHRDLSLTWTTGGFCSGDRRTGDFDTIVRLSDNTFRDTNGQFNDGTGNTTQGNYLIDSLNGRTSGTDAIWFQNARALANSFIQLDFRNALHIANTRGLFITRFRITGSANTAQGTVRFQRQKNDNSWVDIPMSGGGVTSALTLNTWINLDMDTDAKKGANISDVFRILWTAGTGNASPYLHEIELDWGTAPIGYKE